MRRVRYRRWIVPSRFFLCDLGCRNARRTITSVMERLPCFAALDVLQETVIAKCHPRHRHQEFLRFLGRIDESIDPALDIHLVLDNYGTHKHPEVNKWLAGRPRYHLHFTPTSSSWLNQIERWLAEITRKRIRRGTFRSVRDLVLAIQAYVRSYNRDPQPFHWIASASRIIRKVNRYKATSETAA